MNVLRRHITAACLVAMLAIVPGSVCLAEVAQSHADGHGAAEHDVTAHDDHHGPEGYSLKHDLSLWGIVAFVGFLLAVKTLGWDSLTSGMKTREETEVRLLNESEQVREAARAELQRQKGQMEALDEEIREALAEAGRDADHTRSDIRAAADRETRTAQARAEAEIARVKDQSLHDLFETMADRVALAAEQRIREKLSPRDQQELVDAAVNEFATSGK